MWKISLNQEITVGARVGVTESHREPERDRQRARGNQIGLEKTRKSHGEPD